MATLKEALAERIPTRLEEIKSLVKEHGDKVISEVTIQQAYGGMRGVKGLVCDTSLVDPEKGLIIRGIPIIDLTDRTPEEIFYLLCVGELPGEDDLDSVKQEFASRSEVPGYVFDVLRAMPDDAHPMDMFITGILALQNTSAFAKGYNEGMKKDVYWEAAVEDSLQLLAKLPSVAAAVYRIRFNKGDLIPYDSSEDWSTNYARMLGVDDPEFGDLVRLYLVLHCDHEGGNVSAFTSHVVASALSDPYYSVAAGLCGLAGPLHGLANQECLGFLLGILERFGGKAPSADELKDYTWEVLNSGRVVPGFGHAVLRETDPRYTAQYEFGKAHFPDDELFKTMATGFEVIPHVLMEHGKAKNPWPNVDAASGTMLYHYGVTEMIYYTVFFSVSRAMGMLSQLITSRAMMEPITRPKSVTTDWLKAQV
jgi:citrate synthase